MSAERILQYKSAAEDLTLVDVKRQREIQSLTSFLHKHQNDEFSGPSRSALAHAIEKHRALSPPDSKEVKLLIECALKMPEKLFAKAEKKTFLKWYDKEVAPERGDATGGVDLEPLRLLVIDVEEGSLVCTFEDGALYELAVMVDDSERDRIKSALEVSNGQVMCWVGKEGKLKKWEVV